MSDPQQPELARSRRSAASPAAAKNVAPRTRKADAGGVAPIPEDNLPGHHPEVEQDKPVGPPPTPKPRATKAKTKTPAAAPTKKPKTHRSPLRRAEPLATASRIFGVTEDNAYVAVEDDQLEIRFGPWHLTTPLTNVRGADVTGPFHWWKVIGPPHLSLKDRGITFATATDKAVCITFVEPVPAIDPRGVIRHPAATVTVADPDELAKLLNRAA